MDAAYRAIVRFPWLVLVVVAAVTVVLGSGTAHLRVDSSVGTLLPRGDPAQALYAQVIERFGNDEIDIIGVLAPDVLSAATLREDPDGDGTGGGDRRRGAGDQPHQRPRSHRRRARIHRC